MLPYLFEDIRRTNNQKAAREMDKRLAEFKRERESKAAWSIDDLQFLPIAERVASNDILMARQPDLTSNIPLYYRPIFRIHQYRTPTALCLLTTLKKSGYASPSMIGKRH